MISCPFTIRCDIIKNIIIDKSMNSVNPKNLLPFLVKLKFMEVDKNTHFHESFLDSARKDMVINMINSSIMS